MATYANTTNPFIKTSSVDRAKHKRAPGMAKPQNECDDEKDFNLLLINENSSNATMGVSEQPSDNSKYDKNNNHTLLDQVDSDNKSIHLDPDILKATENLVESVIRLELEEQSGGDDVDGCCIEEQDKKKRISSKKKVEFSGLSIDKSNDLVVNSNDHNLNHYNGDDDDYGDEGGAEVDYEQAPMEQDNRKHQHVELIKKLRLQLRDLERYAYERGELGGEVPPSVIAERQTVILDTLKNRLSLNINPDEIGKLELDEFKSQVDKEIQDLINPAVTKEHLLNQLKTQLTDLERYIAHLHGTIGKIPDKRSCLCHIHGCSSPLAENGANLDSKMHNSSGGIFTSINLVDNEALPKTSKLIRSLVAQLICSDMKIQESARKERENDKLSDNESSCKNDPTIVRKQPFNDEAAWTLHLDKVILATDSLVNLFTLEPKYQKSPDKSVDERLVESIVRRQLTPAIKDLLSYGLLDPDSLPHSTSYASIIFNPFYLLSTLTCFPTVKQPSDQPETNLSAEKKHVWNVIEDYYNSRNEPEFKSSSIKTLSQSFDLAPSISGPIKITSKQALLIAVDDIIETLSKCKPNGPESHFRAFIYTALNRSKLSTWIRLVFKNKSVIRRFYHSFSFVSQQDKMDKLLATIEVLNQFEFKLRTDVESIEQFVNAF